LQNKRRRSLWGRWKPGGRQVGEQKRHLILTGAMAEASLEDSSAEVARRTLDVSDFLRRYGVIGTLSLSGGAIHRRI